MELVGVGFGEACLRINGGFPSFLVFEVNDGKVAIRMKISHHIEYVEAFTSLKYEELDSLCEFLGEAQDDRDEQET